MPTSSQPKPLKFRSWKGIGLIFLFFTAVLLLLFLQSPLGRVDSVRVQGNHWITEGEVRKQLSIGEGSSFFGWSADDVEDGLTTLPTIKDVDVQKEYPGVVQVHIREHDHVASWQSGGNVYPVLGNGLIIHQESEQAQHTLLLKEWRQEQVKKIGQALTQLSPDLRKHLVTISPYPNEVYDDGIEMTTVYDHKVFMRLAELDRFTNYEFFRDKPAGKLYILDSIWFVPDAKTASSSD
ncbi:cell division protein FtsQ/DivIB [Mechercharimyces sp. CAU 1602]|uniref:cell division protein FtsQ/DivIB n=1 Tax=Mechercharimyces sp. CAU 1602 TaxID=2973933 RepID=UPI002162E0C3|nr:FtsQ-type POTRA domain-containing protein [Mechercharimyces sp. CAU 1602]